MKTKTITSVLVIILVFAGLFVWGYYAQKGSKASVQGVGNSNNSVSLLVVSETIYDFGAISMKNGEVATSFVVTNPTERTVTLRQIVTSCMCTVAYLETSGGEQGPFGMPGHNGPTAAVNESIAPGESRVLRVVYDPAAHGPAGVGPVNRLVTLTDADGQTLELEIKALVKP